MITFQEKVDSGGYVFPDYVDEATQKLLVNRFGIRRCPKNFDRLFTFDLDVYYPQYLKMLRVDPKATDIDWFVQNYMERQVYAHKAENTEGVENSNGLVNKSGNGSSYNQNTRNEADTGTVGRTTNNSLIKNFSEDGNNTGDSHSVSEGADDKNVRGMSFARTNPMSASYTSSDMNQIYNSNGQTLKAGSKGTISNGGKTYGIPYPKIKNPSTSGDSLSMEAGVTYNENTTNSTNRDHRQGNSSDVSNGSDVENRNLSKNALDINSGNHSFAENDINEGHKQNLGSREGEDLTQEIYTGRNALPADVLRGAVDFISKTNAFKWLYRTLDNNFLQCYEKEDYYEYD